MKLHLRSMFSTQKNTFNFAQKKNLTAVLPMWVKIFMSLLFFGQN